MKKFEYDKALLYYQKAAVNCLKNFNDSVNIITVPVIKDYLDWNKLMKSLQAKAEIFADTNITLPKFKTLAKLKLALCHYQACDILITKVRQEITKKSDKIALGEKASDI